MEVTDGQKPPAPLRHPGVDAIILLLAAMRGVELVHKTPKKPVPQILDFFDSYYIPLTPTERELFR